MKTPKSDYFKFSYNKKNKQAIRLLDVVSYSVTSFFFVSIQLLEFDEAKTAKSSEEESDKSSKKVE